MENLAISEQLLQVIEALEPGDTLEDKVTRLAENELRRRLARYQLSDRQFQAKYGMSLEEFEAAGVVAQMNYSFEVESDHQDWDLAVDGILSTQRQLAELLSKS